MIRINDDWVVDVDQYNYILKKDMHREEKSRDGKSKVPVYNAVGYYASLRKALEALGEETIRDKLRGGSLGLADAVQAIRECTEEWRRLCEEVLNV